MPGVPFIGPILAGIGHAIEGAAISASIAINATLGSSALAAALSGAVVSVGWGAASLTGIYGLSAMLSAWSTVSLLASTFLSKPRVGIGPAGSPVDFQADPSAGIPLMLGRSATAGKIIHANVTGQANKNNGLYYLIALTGGPLGNLESVHANDLNVTPIQGETTAPVIYANRMWLNLSQGLKPEPAATYPGGVLPEYIPEWTPAHKTSGVACIWWTMRFRAESFPTGVPKPRFVIRGPPVYDPRADSTYPGGSGAQRWNDERTWSLAGNDNPFLQGLAWAIGRHDNGVLTFGIGAPIEAIDVPAFVEGANVCEANGWKVGGEVLSSDRKWDALITILQAGGGEPAKLAGLISCQVRAPRVSLGTLVGADIVGDVSITGTKRRRDRINQIIPTYRSEDHDWGLVPAGPVTIPEYVAADGGLRSKEGTYTLVQDALQVAQLATYDLLDLREFEPIVLPLGPRWLGLKPGDCVTITEPEFGMAGQPVIIQTREADLASGKVTITCRSESPSKHDYALGRTPNPPPISGLVPVDPSQVFAPDAGSWVAAGTVLAGADGSQVPAIVVTGHASDDAIGVLVDYRLQLSAGVFGEWVSAEFPRTTVRIELRAVMAGATYNVRVRYRSALNLEGALALDLGLVTVGTLVSGAVSDIGGQTPDELIGQLEDLANSVEGLGNEYVFAVSSGGAGFKRVAGIKLAATPDVSSIAFAADQIGFTNGIDNVYPLAVVGNKVIATHFQADDIKAGTITTDKIVANNISTGIRTGIPAQVVLSTAPTLIISVDFDCSGGYIDLDVCGNMFPTGLPVQTTYNVYVDGAQGPYFGVTAYQSNVGFNSIVFNGRQKLAAGVHNFKVMGQKYGASEQATVSYLFVTIRDNKTEA